MLHEDIADFRRAVRRYLADRPSSAFDPGTMCRTLYREWQCKVGDVANACGFLVDLTPPQIKLVKDTMGGPIKYYQITPAGIIAHEQES